MCPGTKLHCYNNFLLFLNFYLQQLLFNYESDGGCIVATSPDGVQSSLPVPGVIQPSAVRAFSLDSIREDSTDCLSFACHWSWSNFDWILATTTFFLPSRGIFAFSYLPFCFFLFPSFFSAVHRKKSSKNARRKEEEKQWERAHCTQSVEAAAAKRNATKRIRRRSIASNVIGGGKAKKKLSLRCQRQLIWPRSRQEVAPPHSLSPTHTHTRTYMHSVWRTLWVEIECLDVQHGRRQSHKTHHRERERADGVC